MKNAAIATKREPSRVRRNARRLGTQWSLCRRVVQVDASSMHQPPQPLEDISRNIILSVQLHD